MTDTKPVGADTNHDEDVRHSLEHLRDAERAMWPGEPTLHCDHIEAILDALVQEHEAATELLWVITSLAEEGFALDPNEVRVGELQAAHDNAERLMRP